MGQKQGKRTYKGRSHIGALGSAVYLLANVDGMVLQTLLDTGSSLTAISAECFQELRRRKHRSLRPWTYPAVSTAGANKLYPKGITYLSIRLGDRTVAEENSLVIIFFYIYYY
jgi:hypothetical protein